MSKQTLKNRLKGLARTAMKHEERVAAGLEQDNAAAPPVSWGSADAEGKTIVGSAKDLPENYQAAEHIVYGIDVLRQEEQADVVTVGNTDADTDGNTSVDTAESVPAVDGATYVATDVDIDADTKSCAMPVYAVYGMSGQEKLCATLSRQHRAVYEYMLRLPEPWMNTKMADIRNAQGKAVPYDSRRGALVWLARAGFITKRAMRTSAGIKGVAFALSENLAQCFCRLHGLPLPAWLGREPVASIVSTSMSTQIATQVLTQVETPVWLEKLFQQHPEYAFWRKSTTLKDISQLYANTALPQDVFDQYLRWYAFAKGKAAARGRHSALQDFTACLLVDGLRKPEGYLSHEEKALALAEELAREKAERLRRIRLLEEEQASMALNHAFDSMMTRGAADPMYTKLRGGLNAVVLGYEKSEPVLFTRAMRTAFIALFGKEG